MRLLAAMEDSLTPMPLPPNVDTRPLEGLKPWYRLRLGDHRVLCRPETEGWLVVCVVHRRDLERAVRSL